MYRGPFRGPCIGSIYPTLLGFGIIHPLFPSYTESCLLYHSDHQDDEVHSNNFIFFLVRVGDLHILTLRLKKGKNPYNRHTHSQGFEGTNTRVNNKRFGQTVSEANILG